MELIIYISEGVITNRTKISEVFKTLPDGRYKVKIDPFKKRSNLQNNYYHGAVVPLVKDGLLNMGYDEVRTNEDAHEILKHLFLMRKIVNQQTDETIEIAGSTARLSTGEFNAFIDEVIKWGAQYLNIQIPLPNESMVMFAEYDENVNATLVKSEIV